MWKDLAEGDDVVITRVERDETLTYALPGRNWHLYVGPETMPETKATLGVAIYPPGSKPTGHVHDIQQETIYCAAGRGRIVTSDLTADVEPGVAVIVPPGTFHSTEVDGETALELVCFFSPSVVTGSYEQPAKR